MVLCCIPLTSTEDNIPVIMTTAFYLTVVSFSRTIYFSILHDLYRNSLRNIKKISWSCSSHQILQISIPTASIPLIFSHYLSLLVVAPDKFSRRHPVSAQYWWMFFSGQPTLVCPCVGYLCHLWVSPYFSNNAQYVLVIFLRWFVVWKGRWVTVQLLFCWVLLPGFIQNSR